MQPARLQFPAARVLLEQAVANHVTPAAVIEVGHGSDPSWRAAVGQLTYADDAPAANLETVFDLASLTKVIATTTLAMQAVDRGALDLDEPVSTWLPGWRTGVKRQVKVRALLDHSSGLAAVQPLHETAHSREEVPQIVAALPLEYEPGTKSVYSDLGFILLGFILEQLAGERLDAQFQRVTGELAASQLRYLPPPEWRARIAPTQFDTWRQRLLQGEVDDRNAAVMEGVAPHAGLFGTVEAVGAFARAVLSLRVGRRNAPRLAEAGTLARFVQRTGVAGSSRALGWDTMLPTSSCGIRMSPQAFGHTGFTGTSLWLDPERDAYVVLLTNRVHPEAGPSEGITRLRRAVHDAVMERLDG